MSELSKCLLTPHFFLPMEMASVMLLATASFVLLCSVVRCCCRHFCSPLPSASDHGSGSSIDLGELSDASDDESHPPPPTGGRGGSTTTVVAGGAQAARNAQIARDEQHAAKPVDAAAPDDDEELPAYTHISS